jgi:hypothetical protein
MRLLLVILCASLFSVMPLRSELSAWRRHKFAGLQW